MKIKVFPVQAQNQLQTLLGESFGEYPEVKGSFPLTLHQLIFFSFQSPPATLSFS